MLAGEAQPAVKRYSAQELRLTAPQNGVISEEGDFTATPGKSALGSFQLAKVNGEWRISSATDGLYLSPNDFSRDYAVYDTYFVDPASQHLVPNPVYLPVGASQATSLVQALLSGPAPWLAPAVRTAFPPGTRLTVPSAPVKDNIVQVDLTEQVRQASADDVQLLGAQLAWTLAQLDDVNAVRVTAGGLPVSGLNDSIKTASFPSVGDPSGADVGPAIAVAGGRLVTLGEPTLPLAGVLGSGTTALVHPAIATGGGDTPSRAAALDPTGTKLYVGDAADDGTLRIRLQGQGLVAPSFDPRGDVWTASVGQGRTAHLGGAAGRCPAAGHRPGGRDPHRAGSAHRPGRGPGGRDPAVEEGARAVRRPRGPERRRGPARRSAPGRVRADRRHRRRVGNCRQPAGARRGSRVAGSSPISSSRSASCSPLVVRSRTSPP